MEFEIKEVAGETIMKFEIKATIDFDIEHAACSMADFLDDYIVDEYPYKDRCLVDEIRDNSNEILKKIAKYWLENIE